MQTPPPSIKLTSTLMVIEISSDKCFESSYPVYIHTTLATLTKPSVNSNSDILFSAPHASSSRIFCFYVSYMYILRIYNIVNNTSWEILHPVG